MDKATAERQFALSQELYAAKRYLDALKVLDDLDRAFPNSSNLMYARALALAALQRNDNARALCKRAIALHNDPRARSLYDVLTPTREPDLFTPASIAQSPPDKNAKAAPVQAQSRRTHRMIIPAAAGIALAVLAGVVAYVFWAGAEPLVYISHQERQYFPVMCPRAESLGIRPEDTRYRESMVKAMGYTRCPNHLMPLRVTGGIRAVRAPAPPATPIPAETEEKASAIENAPPERDSVQIFLSLDMHAARLKRALRRLSDLQELNRRLSALDTVQEDNGGLLIEKNTLRERQQLLRDGIRAFFGQVSALKSAMAEAGIAWDSAAFEPFPDADSWEKEDPDHVLDTISALLEVLDEARQQQMRAMSSGDVLRFFDIQIADIQHVQAVLADLLAINHQIFDARDEWRAAQAQLDEKNAQDPTPRPSDFGNGDELTEEIVAHYVERYGNLADAMQAIEAEQQRATDYWNGIDEKDSDWLYENYGRDSEDLEKQRTEVYETLRNLWNTRAVCFSLPELPPITALDDEAAAFDRLKRSLAEQMATLIAERAPYEAGSPASTP